MNKPNAATKQADLSSGIGAGLLGLGLGVLLAEELQPISSIVMLVGALLHGWGMWRKHHLDGSDAVELPHWGVVLYWLCWLALPAVAIIVIARATKASG